MTTQNLSIRFCICSKPHFLCSPVQMSKTTCLCVCVCVSVWGGVGVCGGCWVCVWGVGVCVWLCVCVCVFVGGVRCGCVWVWEGCGGVCVCVGLWGGGCSLPKGPNAAVS